MTDTDRRKLAAVLGMLGSEHAGERAAAALQAEAFRRHHNLTWDQLVGGKTVYVDRPVIVETAVDRPIPMPLVQSIVAVIGEPFPMVILTFVTLAAIFGALSRLLGNL
jgi:hypothetical protein